MEGSQGQVREERSHRAIRDCHEEYHYPIEAVCKIRSCHSTAVL